MKRTILYVDNDPAALAFQKLLLEQNGYNCLSAGSIEDAEATLSEEVVHLGLYDYRLIDDNDPNDHSGLLLLRKTPPYVPVVILSGFREFQSVRDAMRHAVDYLYKLDPPESKLKAITEAFEEKVEVNFDLEIPERSIRLLRLLIRGLDPLVAGSGGIDAAERHLETVVRRLFYSIGEDADHDRLQRYIKVDFRSLDQGAGGSAVALASPTRVETAPEPGPEIVVKFGLASSVRQEHARYFRFVAPFLTGCTTTVIGPCYSGEIGGTGYSFAGGIRGNVKLLGDYYESSEASDLEAMFDRLFRETCAGWHSQTSETNDPLARIYRDLLGLDKTSRVTRMEDHLDELGDLRRPGLRIARQEATGTIQVKVSRREALVLPNPMNFLDDRSLGAIPGEYNSIVHGDLHCGNLLVDSAGLAWLIDFGRTTDKGPLFADFAELETSIRIDLLTEQGPDSLLAFEHCLAQQREFGEAPPLPQRLEKNESILKCYKTISALRRIAGECFLVESMLPYFVGLFFNAMNKLSIRLDSGMPPPTRPTRTRASTRSSRPPSSQES